MGRPALGDRPLTQAERQARQRERKAAEAAGWRDALERIVAARTVREAREIATAALRPDNS